MPARMPIRLTLAELCEMIVRQVGLELRVCLPARVLEYIPPTAGPRPTPPRVRVRCDLLYAREGAADEAGPGEVHVPSTDPSDPGELIGEYAEGSIPVPVHFPGGWGGWSRGPLLPGEWGKLVFTDRSIDGWQIDGGVGDPLDPVFPHTHGFNLCDAFFEPGVRSGAAMAATTPGPSVVPADAHAWGLADGSAGLEIRHPTGNPTTQRDVKLSTTGQLVRIDAVGKVVAGNPATAAPLAKAAPLSANLDALNQAVQSIPATGVPQTDAALTAIKGAFAAAFLTFAPIATTKIQGD